MFKRNVNKIGAAFYWYVNQIQIKLIKVNMSAYQNQKSIKVKVKRQCK